jgi:hypothetical protein
MLLFVFNLFTKEGVSLTLTICNKNKPLSHFSKFPTAKKLDGIKPEIFLQRWLCNPRSQDWLLVALLAFLSRPKKTYFQ